jgi:5'-nucleotidase
VSSSRTRLIALGALALTSLVAVPSVSASAKGPKPIPLQILALNDFHGQLEPINPTQSSGGRIGALSGGQCNPPAC